ncbi:MAG: HD domain-containing protein [Thermodesulfobacteriota bacterium]|nr:HD domain-containing protein [Thermodesulfobacteriota bacterium]
MNKETTVLVVEDETVIARDILSKLQGLGYDVPLVVCSGEEAIEKTGELRPDLVMMDIVIEGKIDGIEAADQIRKHFNIPVVYLTAYADEEVLERAKITEPFGYMVKPFDERGLHSTIEMALYKHKSAENLMKSMEETINALASALEMRDPYTAGHQKRVAQLAEAIAGEMNRPYDEVRGIRLAALIHDIGKIRVPSEILSKPGKLMENEFGLIKTHPQIGYDIVKKIEFPWPIADIIYQHHERLDGSGYPRGLKGDEIILQARIIAVADVVEAMSSHRPYRAALGIGKALAELTENRGILYDPDAVDACLKLFREKGFKLEDRTDNW